MVDQTYFSAHEIAARTTDDHLQCIAVCLDIQECLSVNVKTVNEGENCVLNNATRWEDSESLITSPTDGLNHLTWTYYESTHPING